MSPSQNGEKSSYPPLFRRLTAGSPSQDSDPTIEPPLIDLHDLDAAVFLDACRNWGLFRVANHGVPPTLSFELQRRAKQLISLPFDSKLRSFKLSDPVTYFWGTPTLTHSVASLNWLEGFHVPLSHQIEVGDGSDGAPDHDLGSFRHLLKEYGDHQARIARSLFNTMAIDLELDSEQTASYLSESEGMLRVYRYPACLENSNYFGMDSHTDSSVLSIVNQDEVGGLQLRKDQTWFHVRPIPDTFVVNLGDMMQAISDDKYRSVEHRVLASSSRERFSICYFAFPREDEVIISSRYKAFTYKEFKARVQEDISAFGFKVGLGRFRI